MRVCNKRKTLAKKLDIGRRKTVVGWREQREREGERKEGRTIHNTGFSHLRALFCATATTLNHICITNPIAAKAALAGNKPNQHEDAKHEKSQQLTKAVLHKSTHSVHYKFQTAALHYLAVH
jgi:hypothetical protein